MSLTKAEIKLYASLAQKKHRTANSLFVAEGTKCVLDTLDAFEAVAILATDSWVQAHPTDTARIATHLQLVPPKVMQQISSLSTPPQLLAIYRMPQYNAQDFVLKGRLTILLDGVQDPGNLGTILRIADWFGITQIVASTDTVDVYNAKSVQATMGAIAKVKVAYTDLPTFISQNPRIPVYGTLLEGNDIYKSQLSTEGMIVFGNEGKGLTTPVRSLISDALYIPPYPGEEQGSESLNVAVAAAVTIAEFRRRQRH